MRRRRARNPDQPDFAAALTAARGGEERGFEHLFRLFDRRLHAFARLRRAADPEGLVNEVLLQVFRNLDSFDGSEAAFTGWVFTIARNKLIDEARKRDRRVDEVGDPDGSVARRRSGGNAETDAVQRLSDQEMLGLVDRLTPDQRDVVLLRVVADLPIEATAEILGKQPGAVKALQRRALATLNRELSASPYPDNQPMRSCT